MDRELLFAEANTRLAKTWRNQRTTWADFHTRLEHVRRTAATTAEYHAMTKAQQGDVKDVGGFVGGHLAGGVRKKGKVLTRSLLTLDIDNPSPGLLDTLGDSLPFEWLVYSTQSHTPENPRYRLIMPLSRDVSGDEYEAIGRRVAADVGIDQFDDSTYQPHRLMYWPSAPADLDPVYVHHEGDWVDADDILGRYADWKDVTTWPTSSRQQQVLTTRVERQANPLDKPGLVGAFCRTYTIHQVIAEFLAHVYEPSDTMDGRYTYIPGETSNGVVTYDDKFAYSHHGTDPAGGQLVNAFDLLRIHKFGAEDDGATGKSGNQLPSYHAAINLIREDTNVKMQLATERQAQAADDFATLVVTEETKKENAWMAELDVNAKGEVLDTLKNQVRIFRHDPNLQGIAYNEHRSGLDIMPGHPLPWHQVKPGWSGSDDALLKVYLEKAYGFYAPGKTKEAVTAAAAERVFHPVRQYLDHLPEWDGVERVDRLLVDYLGAPDTEYTRAVTRKTLVAAVARVRKPGCKFDQVLILNGPQGIGKSTVFARLAGEWFSDALTLLDMKDKSGAEKLQGYWILELGELAGMRKMEVETVKSFLSRTDDKFRPAYGSVVESHPRQCIIVGSTNAESGFLRDVTGNRRFWPVTVTGAGTRHTWDLTSTEIEQIWAEAHARYDTGEALYLTGAVAQAAQTEQDKAIESDERLGLVESYLDTPLPADWENRSLYERRQYLGGDLAEFQPLGSPAELVERTTVSHIEIWAECFGNDPTKMAAKDAYMIRGLMQKLPEWNKPESGGARLYVYPYGRQRVYTRSERPPF